MRCQGCILVLVKFRTCLPEQALIFLAIPTVPDGGNHTRDFAKAAKTIEAHNACLDVSKALTGCAVRVLLDDAFFEEVSAESCRVLLTDSCSR